MSIGTTSSATEIGHILADPAISKVVQSDDCLSIWDNKIKESFNIHEIFVKYLLDKTNEFETLIKSNKKTYLKYDKLFSQSSNTYSFNRSFLNNLNEMNTSDNKTIQILDNYIKELKTITEELKVGLVFYTNEHKEQIEKAMTLENDYTALNKKNQKVKETYTKYCNEVVKLKGSNQLTSQKEEQLRAKIKYSYMEFKELEMTTKSRISLLKDKDRPNYSKLFLELYLEINDLLKLQLLRFFKLKEKIFTILALNLFENSSVGGGNLDGLNSNTTNGNGNNGGSSRHSSNSGLNSVIDFGDSKAEIYEYLKAIGDNKQ